MVAHKFPGQVIQIDMDYHTHEDIPESSDKVVLVEDVHGLERSPEQYDKIIVITQRISCFYFSLYYKIGQLAVKQKIQCVA